MDPSREPLTTWQLAAPRARDGERLRERERKKPVFYNRILEGHHISSFLPYAKPGTIWEMTLRTNIEYQAHRKPSWRLATTQGVLVLPPQS